MSKTIFDPHDPSLRQASVLSTAVAAGNVEWVDACLRAGADPATHVGVPLPLLAVMRHHHDVLARLIATGMDLNEANEYGFTALHQAARADPAMVAVLLAAGADPEARDCDGRPPLAYAMLRGDAAAAAALCAAGTIDPARDADPVTQQPYALLNATMASAPEKPDQQDQAATAPDNAPRPIQAAGAAEFGLSKPASRRPSP